MRKQDIKQVQTRGLDECHDEFTPGQCMTASGRLPALERNRSYHKHHTLQALNGLAN